MVTIAEAAICFGVSQDTIRRWMIDLDIQEPANSSYDMARAQMSESAIATMEEVHGWESLVATLKSQVAGQQEQLSAKDVQLETKDRQIQELHILLKQAHAALPAPKENRRSARWRFWRR